MSPEILSCKSLNMHAQRSPRRNISENVRKIYSALTTVLSNEDRAFLIQSLNQYQRERDIRQLVFTLNSALDTPGKREVYSLLHQIIPHSDKELFQTLWLHDADHHSRSSPRFNRSNRDHQRMPSSSKMYASDSGIDLSSSTKFRSSPNKHPIKRLVLKRPSRGGFGFCIRGGAEHGIGLYVSSVDGNSVAENQGLLQGDHILLANDTKFDGVTHTQAVKIIQRSERLHLVVQSVGRIPNSYFAETTCNWVDVRGRRASPPPGMDSNGRALTAHGIHKSDLRLLGDDDERKAGDQILDVNGRSFLDITHKKAVKVLKSTKSMILTLKDVGRLPFTRVTRDKTKWIKRPFLNGQTQSVPEVTHITETDVHTAPGSKRPSSSPLSSRWRTTDHRLGHEQDTEPSKFHHGLAGSQILYNGGLPSHKNLLTEQARLLLSESELGIMKYYLDEYSKGSVKISGLVLALFDLLDTQEKRSLITDIRGCVAPKDIDKFDDLVLKKEIEIMENYQFLRNHMCEDTRSLQSNASSVSSFSGVGSSSSSRCSELSAVCAGLSSISASWVSDVFPENVKVISDSKVGYDVYEATLTFNDEEEETLLDDEFQQLPTILTITPTSLDLPVGESTLMAESARTVQPLLDSSPESLRNETASLTKTNGKATPSANFSDYSRSETTARQSPPFTEHAFKGDDVCDETASSLVINTESNAGINSSTSKSPSSPPSFSGAADQLKFPLNYRDTNIEPKKKTTPTNPFVFPSKYTDTQSGVEGHASTTESVHLSKYGTLKIGQPTTMSGKVKANSAQDTRLSKREVEKKYLPTEEGKKGVVR